MGLLLGYNNGELKGVLQAQGMYPLSIENFLSKRNEVPPPPPPEIGNRGPGGGRCPDARTWGASLRWTPHPPQLRIALRKLRLGDSCDGVTLPPVSGP